MLHGFLLVGSRHLLNVDCMRINAVEADDVVLGVDDDPDTNDVCLAALFRRRLQVVIDLRDATGKSRPIMCPGIERLNCGNYSGSQTWLFSGV